MAREVRSGTTLSGVESVMWRLGSDPRLSATFGTVSLLDSVPDRARFEARLTRALDAVPRLRQVVRPSPIPGMAPTWADDPAFDLAHHLRWIDLGEGGPPDERDVLDAAARLVASPFDPARPLWEFQVVEGLPDGRAALVQRMHHVVTDGEGGIRLSEQYIDAGPDEPAPTPDAFVGGDAPPPATTWGERLVLTTSERVGSLARTAVDAARWTAEGVNDPQRFSRAGSDVLDAAASLRRQLLVLDPARSPLWTARGDERRLVTATVPFGPVRAAATTAGVSVNVVFVTAVLRGAASYHRALGRPVEELRVAVPVSTRHDASAGGNAFSPMRAVLPTGDGLTAAAHLTQVADRLAGTTHERSAELLGPLAGAADAVPTPLLGAVVRRQAATTDLVASNLRAAPFPLYVAGARIRATYPLGPLFGTPCNVTMMTYDGRVDLGVHVDVAAVEDPDRLRDSLVGAFHELTAGN